MPAQKRLIVINGSAKPWQDAANERIEAGENFVLIVQNTPHELATLKDFLRDSELPRQCNDPREWQKHGRYLSIEDEANLQNALASRHSIFYVELIRTGRIRAIAVTSAKRSNAAPDIPTVAESGVAGYEATSWFGMLAPAGTPKSIITKLNTESLNVLRTPEVQQNLVRQGMDPTGTTPAEFDAYLRSEIAKWTRVVKEAGIRGE